MLNREQQQNPVVDIVDERGDDVEHVRPFVDDDAMRDGARLTPAALPPSDAVPVWIGFDRGVDLGPFG